MTQQRAFHGKTLHRLIALPLALAFAPAGLALGDEPPEGPPWKLSYREARRDALRHGRPILTYFTKTY
jgi:hypothetical protein